MKILLISHASMAEGAHKAVGMIFGNNSNISFLCFEEGMSSDTYRQLLKNKIDSFYPFKYLFIIADLKGGSPYNAAAECLSDGKLKKSAALLSGLSLPLVFAVIEDFMSGGDVNIDDILKKSREGLDIFVPGCCNDEDEIL